MNIEAALAHAMVSLQGSSETVRQDVRLLLAHVLNCGISRLIAYPEQTLSDQQKADFLALIARRSEGQPVAYLIGERGFWSLDLKVGPDVLIPRPETELLVETALKLLPETNSRVLDLGTGSGAIALAIASERPQWEVIATDLSEAALSIAKTNRDTLGLKQVRMQQGSWYEALQDEAPFDLIVSNPPYIEDGDEHLVTGDLRFEPSGALSSGVDGLDDIRVITSGAIERLSPNGWLLIEHGYKQSAAVMDLYKQAGFINTVALKDYAGHQRAALGQKKCSLGLDA